MTEVTPKTDMYQFLNWKFILGVQNEWISIGPKTSLPSYY